MSERGRKLLATRAGMVDKQQVEAWGETFWVWGLTGRERDLYEQARWKRVAGKLVMDLVNTRARLVALSLRESDQPGALRVFQDGDVARLGELDGATLDRLFQVASKLSGMDAGDEEDAEKNSASGPSAASSSDSPPCLDGAASPGDCGASAAPS